ncbi:MAG: GNAT family N-acetyltransferase [Spirochaetes bacterium]|nr:GNAT family N-acetyltransferase [Spirochaetota bacterium]
MPRPAPASAPGYHVDAAREGDIAAVMELEAGGFHDGITESEEVFRARLAAFPQGFMLLRYEGRVAGYLCCERWADVRLGDPESFALGHDPVPRYAPGGPVLYVASMTVDARFRGAGLGAFLFREGRARVRSLAPGISLEALLVNEEWTAARRIYEAEGFAVRGVLPGFFPARDGEPTAGLVMARGALDGASSGRASGPG